MTRCALGVLWTGESVSVIRCAVFKSVRLCSSSLSIGVETPEEFPASNDVLGWIEPGRPARSFSPPGPVTVTEGSGSRRDRTW